MFYLSLLFEVVCYGFHALYLDSLWPNFSRYDLHSGTIDAIGSHQDMATCVGYSIETCQVISAGLDKKLLEQQ